MLPERWRKIEEIFEAAVEIAPPDERTRFVAEACAGDDGLKIEIEKLLAQDAEAEDLMSSPLMDDSGLHVFAQMLDEQQRDPLIGKTIGAFRLTKEIGRGGMGAVYLAMRADGSFRQKVAIKLVKRGMDTDFILRRFRQERQIAAALGHPFIARLLGGGATDDNLPYFVMEYVEGAPLYKYCDGKKLSINERLKLFQKICQAVDYAHQNQIIHRDLKPPNILVTANGTPKLLDFGIAKVLNPELNTDTIDPTATAMRLMTPEYASPEQVCGSPVAPASDIYSLGVLLYELLTGHRPYRFDSRAPFEIARVICDEEPLRPSAGITREDNLLPTGAGGAATLDQICFFRGASNIEDLQKELAGDIEKVILKCLRKDPNERYQTAAELAADITRYLDGEPLLAEARFPEVAALPVSVAAVSSNKKTKAKKLAVLPLKILNYAPNADASEDFLSVGLADALISRLSGIKRLIVRPTSSVLRFNGGDSFAAGRELDVDFVVDGNIRRAGGKIRVTAQLLNVRENSTTWSESFDEHFTDVLALEDSISERVVKSLIPQLTGEEQEKFARRGTNSPEAFEAYMRGRFRWNQFTPDALAKAREAFQTAIELDPNYALAYVGLADFYIWANIYGMIPSGEAVALAQAAAGRAIELDPLSGEAYASLGLTYQNRFSWAKAVGLYEQALKLAPNYVHAHEWFAAQLVGHGNIERGVEEIKIAERLDPLSLRTKTLTAWTLYQARRFDEALARGRQIIDLDANYPQGHSQIGITLLAMGSAREALPYLQRFDAMIPDSALAKFQLCFAFVAVGRRDDAKRVLEEIKRLAEVGCVKPYFLAMAHAALDERDAAFADFERAVNESEPWMLWFGTEPMLENLRGDERFDDVLRRMNNPLAKPKKVKIERKPEDAKSEKSIAVLPLKLIDGGAPQNEADTGDDYLCIGLADALITRFSNVRRFLVRPTSSVIGYGKKQTDALTAGRELGVDFIIDGTIQRAGERLRITARLLNVKENAIGWSQSFDEKFEDVLALEDAVSEQVAELILPHLTGAEKQRLKKRGTDNPQAFEAYLRGRFYWNAFTEEGFAKSLVYYNRAIAVAPDYALAYAGIADYYNLLGVYSILPFAETAAAAAEAAQTAIAADDQLAEGYAALGFAVLMRDFDWAEADKHLRRAVELNPNYVTGLIWHSSFLSVQGKSDDALKQIRRALELDPNTPVVSHTLNLTLYYARRFDEAIAATEKFIVREPTYGLARLFLSSVLWRVGRVREALDYVNRAVELMGRTPYTLCWLASAYAAGGDAAEARRLIAEIEELSVRRYVSPYLLAMIHVNLNDAEKALDLLEKAREIRDGRLVWLGIDPQFDRLRSSPRFETILRQMKNPYIFS